eukprot:scaffold57060_cov38-Prasinocladus_malaysianus.AAC.1
MMMTVIMIIMIIMITIRITTILTNNNNNNDNNNNNNSNNNKNVKADVYLRADSDRKSQGGVDLYADPPVPIKNVMELKR